MSDGRDDSGAVWAPDGRQLAFVRGAPGAAPEIFTISSGGGKPQPLVAGRAVTWGG